MIALADDTPIAAAGSTVDRKSFVREPGDQPPRGPSYIQACLAALVDGNHLGALTELEAKSVLVWLRYANNDSGEAFPSVDTVADRIGTANAGRARQALQGLESKGVLETTFAGQRGGMSTRRRLLSLPPRARKGDGERPLQAGKGDGERPEKGTLTVSKGDAERPEKGTQTVPLTTQGTSQGTGHPPSEDAGTPAATSGKSSRRKRERKAGPDDPKLRTVPASLPPGLPHADLSPDRVGCWRGGKVVCVIPLVGNKWGCVTEDWVAQQQECYPAIDVTQELRSYKAWALNNPIDRKTPCGLAKSIDTWLRKEQNDAARKRLNSNPSSRHGTQQHNPGNEPEHRRAKREREFPEPEREIAEFQLPAA